MAPQWYFTAEALANSPSRKCGIDADKERLYRQQTTYFIQEMGNSLRVSELCRNTAIVYMHRFYAFHSFTLFNRHRIAAASLFLAAKVEEQPRKVEHVICAALRCLNVPPNRFGEFFAEQVRDMLYNEHILLQTLGFDLLIDHPHSHIVKACQLVRACRDLTKNSYFIASTSLHLTTMCLRYRPTVVACFCIHLACRWSNWEIPHSSKGLLWYQHVDESVTEELLVQLTEEFLLIYDKIPSNGLKMHCSTQAVDHNPRQPDKDRPLFPHHQQRMEPFPSSSKSCFGDARWTHPSSYNSRGYQCVEKTLQKTTCTPGAPGQREKKVATVKPMTSCTAISGVKRSFNEMTRQERDTGTREAKMQRSEMENDARASMNFLNLGEKSTAIPPSLANSIETNPYLVSCLLKESLSESSCETQQPAIVVNSKPGTAQEVVTGPVQHKSKAEKKKKKDKRKHKEKKKNKSKDREERKKHKKEKKERKRGADFGVKLKIPIDRLRMDRL